MKKILRFFLMVFAFVPLFSPSHKTILKQSQQEFASSQTSSVAQLKSASSPQITSINWNPESHVIEVELAPWPNTWDSWKYFIDGNEIETKEENRMVVIRPNAPLSKPPSGLIIGTLPWVTGLDNVDIPCCGSLQINIPGVGLTNAFPYNLIDDGCKTTAIKECTSEWTIHEGDWIIKGNEVMTLENKKFLQKGNIYIKDSAKLILKNSEMKIERGTVPTVHVYFFIDPRATLVIDHSQVYPGKGEQGGLTCVFNQGIAKIFDSPTQIHYFDMSGNASLTMDNSSMIYEIGGLLQVTGGSTAVTNSTISALALNVPNGTHLNANGLKSGTLFKNWKVQDMIPEAKYKLTLDNVKLLEDDWVGELEHGSFERGWIFFLDRNSHVNISDSYLRKIFFDIQNDTVEFNGLKVSTPVSVKYRDIDIIKTDVKGEWGFTINNSNVTFRDSNYLFLQTFGSSTVKLINSHIVEYIPRNFTGTMIFENGTWANAGEFIGGEAYHSNTNDFTIKGSLKMGDDIQNNLQWKNARVTREFDNFLTDSKGNPIPGGVVKVDGKEYMADANGKATFSIVFDEHNYKQFIELSAFVSDTAFGTQRINFFTETPIRFIYNSK